MGNMGEFLKIWEEIWEIWEIWEIREIWENWAPCNGENVKDLEKHLPLQKCQIPVLV